MKCPFCQSNTKVYNSRRSHYETQTWRRRQCLACNKAFTTREKVDFNGIVTVRTATTTDPYNQERLLLSLVRVSDQLSLPAGMVSELTHSIETELQKNGFFQHSPQESSIIISTATTVLRRYNKNLALLYVTNVYNNNPPEDVLRKLLQPKGSS